MHAVSVKSMFNLHTQDPITKFTITLHINHHTLWSYFSMVHLYHIQGIITIVYRLCAIAIDIDIFQLTTTMTNIDYEFNHRKASKSPDYTLSSPHFVKLTARNLHTLFADCKSQHTNH